MFSKKNIETLPNESNNIIGKGTSIIGSITSVGNIRVEGIVQGEITTKAKLVLAKNATIQGNIFAHNVQIAGKIEGNLKVSALLILKSTAIIQGDITTNKLICEEGARFNGKCTMQESKKIQHIHLDKNKASKKISL